MKKLIEQMLKFGVVGFVCFFIDYLIGIIVLNIILHTAGEQFFELASMAGSALRLHNLRYCELYIEF